MVRPFFSLELTYYFRGGCKLIFGLGRFSIVLITISIVIVPIGALSGR